MLYFPEPLPDSRALQQQVEQLESDLSTARILTLVALAAAVAAVALGALSLARKR
jgi:hypothetical protein